MKRSLLTLAIFASLTSSVAHAEDSAYAEAKRRMAEGKALFDKSRYEEARLRFLQACAVLRTGNCVRSLAVTEMMDQRPLDSYRHFNEYLNDPKASGALDANGRKELEGLRKKVFDQLGHIHVDTSAGAHILVDGVDVGVAPIAEATDVMPGEHTAEAQLGEKKQRVIVNATAGQDVRAQLTFATEPPIPLPTIAPVPSAGPPTTSPPPPSSGTDQPVAGAGVGTAGTVARWSLTGVGVMGLGLGIVFAAEASSKENDAETFRATMSPACASATSAACAHYQSLLDDHSSAATTSRVFYVVGAVGVVGAVAAWLWWPQQKNSSGSAAWIAPGIGPGVALVQAGGRF